MNDDADKKLDELETQLVPTPNITPNIDLSVSADDPDVTEEVAKAMNK